MTQEELKALKVRDILTMPEFKEEMARQISIEEESMKKASIEAVSKGCRLQRTPVDRLREREVYNADMMCQLFEAVLNKPLLVLWPDMVIGMERSCAIGGILVEFDNHHWMVER